MTHSGCFSGPSLFDSFRYASEGLMTRPDQWTSGRSILGWKGNCNRWISDMLYWKEEAERVFWHCLPPLRGCVHNAGTLRRQPENPLVSSLCYCKETSGDPLGPFGWLRGQLEESATCRTSTCKDSSEFPSRDRRRRFARQLGLPPVSLRIRLPSTLPSCGLRTRAVGFFRCVSRQVKLH